VSSPEGWCEPLCTAAASRPLPAVLIPQMGEAPDLSEYICANPVDPCFDAPLGELRGG